jgi:hypothetical protein
MKFQRIFAVGTALAAPVGAYILYRFPPTPSSWYPKCVFNQLTHCYCPGCGATRCLHALVHGDFLMAFRFNGMFMLLLPLIGYAGGRIWFSCLTGRPLPADRTPRWVVYALLAVILLFGVLRNIPYPPFDLLAPPALAGGSP